MYWNGKCVEMKYMIELDGNMLLVKGKYLM